MTHAITHDFTQQWHLVLASDSTHTTQLAARELRHFWQLCTGIALSTTSAQPTTPHIQLSVVDMGGDRDQFRWHVTADRIEISGQTPRALLFGVYHFLETLGCRWLAPEPMWQRIPRLRQYTFAAQSVTESPALAGRCLIIGHYAFMVDVEAWIVWAARNRYNTIFIHTIPNETGGGAVPIWAWRAVRDETMALLKERGMTIELGGHGLPALLPRKLFKTMPLAFREQDGKRAQRYNFCPSNPTAKRIVQTNARLFFRNNPDVDVYHIWADDIPGGGWCSCVDCRTLSTSDQLLLATNHVAEVLAEMAHSAEISFIAYLDTEAPPTQIKPAPNVCLLYAPRTRNYGRAIDDAADAVNTPYYPQILTNQMDALREAGTVRVFEYYSDAILFKSVLPILPTVMQQDLRFYRDSGVHTVQTLMTGNRPWLTAQLTNWLFGRLTWNPETDVDALIEDFCVAAFGDASAEMVTYYATLEQAFAIVLHQTPDQRKHARFPESALGLIQDPIADMEDPVHASAETLVARSAEIPFLNTLIDNADAFLKHAMRINGSPTLLAEQKAFALTKLWLRFGSQRIELYASIASGAPQATIRSRWEATQHTYEQILAWSETHLSEPFRSNFRLMNIGMWELRLRRIKADHLTSRVGRWRVDAGTIARAASASASVAWQFRNAKKKNSHQ